MRRVQFRSSLESATGGEGDVDQSDRQEGVQEFYPLEDLLQEAVQQEKLVWEKTKGVRLSTTDDDVQSLRAADGMSTVGGSSASMLTASTLTSLPDPNTTYLIRYGQLTDDLHKFFRKLEKEHACLHLTGRRAIFENLRLHPEDTVSTTSTIRQATAAVPTARQRNTHRVTEVHILKDEELLVYRCALMCAQFPMLSAPSPPGDRSPTPHLPTPLINSVSMGFTKPSSEGLLAAAPGPVPMSSSAPHAVHIPQPRRHPLNPESTDHRHTPSLDKKPTSRSTQDDQDQSSVVKPKPKRTLRLPIVRDQYTDDEEDDEELSKLSASHLSAGLSDGPLGREQPFTPMVNREMLCSLVRCSFQQTEEQQLQFEQILRHEYGRKSKGEILARELVAQQQVLENNSHPFYKPRNFVTRNGYEIWLQAEKSRIKEHLDKFWHYQLPRPLIHSTSPDYHRAYCCLLEKIICYESRSPRREPVHGGRTPSAPLSPTAQRLLTEFGLRFGVGELYRRLAYLDYLAKHFDYEAWYIRHCTDELKTIRSYIPRNRTKMSTTRQEMDILKKTVHLLHGQADNSLTRITRLFQDEADPSLGVATLIELLRELLDAEQVLFNNKRVRTLDEWLKKYLRCGFVLRYERKKEIVSDEIFSRNNIAPFMLTPVLINALLLAIREEVNDFRDKYQPVFRRYFNVVPLAKVEFYRLLCSDACTLCARVIHNPSSRQKLNLEMMGLLYRLNDRDIEWCGVIPTEMQQWRNQFVHLALIWMEVLTKQANQWILAALTRDTWGLLSISGPSLSSSSTPSLRGCSPAGSSGLLPTGPSPFQPTLIGAAYLSQHSSAFTPVAPISRNFSPIMTETSGAVSDSSYSLTSNDSTPSELSPVKRPQLVRLRSGSMSSNSPLNFGRTGEPPLLRETLVSHLPAPNTDYEGDSEREGDHVITLVRSRVKSHDSDSQVNEEEDGEGMEREPDRVVNGFANPSFEHSSGDDELKKRFPHHDLAVNTPLPPSSPSHDSSPPLNSSRVLPSRPPHLSVVRPSAFSPHPVEEDEELPDVPSSSIITLPSTPTASVDQEAVLLPLSSSPVDILTMFTRMASFVGMLLSVLTPKLRQGFQSNRSAQASSEMPNEVAQVREQIAEIQRQTETMRIEFLKRLHKTMMNSLKLYADNILCMDLCCWPHGEARAILGDEMMHHLQRRKDNQEIWGCRHIVEARFGLHPDGIPCQKKTASKFENITRDMCVRVNNIHALISIFKSLESHVYSTTFSPSQRYPFAASSFGGLSSTTTTESTSLLQSIELHTQRPNPHRYRKEQSNATNIQLLPTHESDQVGSDASIYGISPAQKRKMESGFQSGESRQLLDYLNRVQEYQLKMLSVRFNKFFQPALSLLLKLKLSKPIGRRLDPIVTYLSRHKTAFRKYIYPKCFQELMIHIWIKIVQDLEEEALKLKKEKKPVSRQAHQLLQTVAHLIKVMDNEDDGLFMDKMISSTEYLLALLDMFIQSTDRLIRSFNTLNAPQLTNTHITLNSSTTPIDPPFLHSLRSKLHSIRKCFSGSEFVEAVVQIGQDKQEELTAPTSETGQPLAYNYSYATEVGQHLLNERILVCVLQHHVDPVLNGLESSSTERMHAIDTTFHSSTEYQHHSPSSTSSTHSIGSIRDGEDAATSRRVFQNSHQSLYRFVDMEDRESGFVFHSMQVLTAALSNSNLPNSNQPEMRRRGNEMSEFDQARFTTQVMIADILQQRVRNDKLAKTFLASPHVVQVLQRAELTDQQAYKLIRI